MATIKSMIGKLLQSPVVKIRIIAAVAAFLMWELAASTGPLADYLSHSWDISSAVQRVLSTDAFPEHLKATMFALVVGVSIGAGTGVVLGLLIASNRLLRLVFEPLIVYLGAVPKIVMYPILVWFLSVGLASKTGMSVLSAFFPVVIQTIGAVWVIRPVWPKAAKMLGASPVRRLVYVSLPAMAPTIATGIRLGVSAGIVGTLAAETKVGNRGIGYLIIHYYSRFELPEMYAVVLIAFVGASLIALVLERLSRHIAGSERRRSNQSVMI